MGVKRMDKIELPDWFRQEIDEVAQDLHNAQEAPMVRQGLAQTKIARLPVWPTTPPRARSE